MRELLESAGRGDRDAFAALVASSVDRLYAIACRILHDPDRAQDAVQSALLRAWRDLPSLRDPTLFDRWLHRILVRACYDEARQRRRVFDASVRPLPSEPTAPDASAALADRDQLERAFRRLSVEHRTAVVLHYYVGLGLSEIADVLAIPEGTVRSRIHYALRSLRGAVEADGRVIEEGGVA